MVRHDASVRETLRKIIMVTAVSALVLAGAGFIGSDLVTSRRSMEGDLAILADVIASNSAAALMFQDAQSATTILNALNAHPSFIAARLYTEDGRPLATRTRSGEPKQLPDVAPPPSLRVTVRGVEIVRPVFYDGENIGTLYILSSLSQFAENVRRDAFIIVCILIVSVLAAFGLSALLGKRLSDPILTLSSLADRVRRKKDYSLRTPAEERVPREINGLVSAFNEMLAEIQRRDEELQRNREDLSNRVEAQTVALRNAAQHKQLVLDTAGEGIFGLGPDGVATFINAAAARVLGFSVEELIGTRLHDVIHPDPIAPRDWQQCSVCSNVLEPPIRAGRVDTFIARDGHRFPVEYTTSTMHEGGGAGVVVTFRDITQRRAVERMKDEFVSTVSHELRTPLTSIRGALGLLGAGLLGESSPRAQRMLDIALSNTDRLVRLINDILDLERISSGRVELNRTLTSAADLMHDAVEVVQAVADRASVAIKVEPQHQLLWVDRDRIVQTLTNLLANAVKFSDAGAQVRLHGKADGEWFTFSVTDEGRGIPEDKLELIFERFRQVDASDRREKGGSGLGLAISRSIVGAHGGRIWAESEAGKGSTFRFTVPVAATQTAADETTIDVAALDGQDRHVLVIEDDADLARIIVESLESRGLRSVAATTGAEAMAACRSMTPALVILDVGLPDVDGFAIIEWMRGQPALGNTPLVVYSASELNARDQERLRLGRTLFLTKSCVPFTALERSAMMLLREEDVDAA